MKNLVFMSWVLIWPVVYSVTNYLDVVSKIKSGEPAFSSDVIGISAFIYIMIWVFVGTLLYEK